MAQRTWSKELAQALRELVTYCQFHSSSGKLSRDKACRILSEYDNRKKKS